MEIILYNTKSANNVIGKTLTDEKSYNMNLKKNTNVYTPMIILNSDDFIDANYAYVPEWKRYYFITHIELYPNKIYYVYMKCDVLESFKDDILNLYGYVNQQTQNIDYYYDSGYANEVRKEVDLYKSDVVLPDVTTTVLTTIGG